MIHHSFIKNVEQLKMSLLADERIKMLNNQEK